MFKGSLAALVTPMNLDGTIDKKSLQNLIEWHIESGTDGLVIAGTTGESPTLSEAEHEDLIASVVKQAKKRIPVIAGAGSDCTEHSVRLALNGKKAGADACLIVTPYYNKPTQKGLIAHYQFIAEKADIPIILYNVPGRTACDLLPETAEKIAKIRRIIGIKEATGKIERASDILKRCGKEFVIYSGDDATAFDLMMQGAQGVISVTANVAPKKMHRMCKEILSGNSEAAKKINEELMPLHKKLFLESNPIPVKWALHQMGKIPAGIRLPLLPLDAQFHTELKEAMRSCDY